MRAFSGLGLLLSIMLGLPVSRVSAMPADTLTDVARMPAHDWRDLARDLPGISALAHGAVWSPFGPVLFRRGGSPATTSVKLEGLSLTDPFTGGAVFTLPLYAIESISQSEDGGLVLAPRRPMRGGLSVSLGASSENIVSAATGPVRPGRERYDFLALAASEGRLGRLEWTAAGQARQLADRDPRFVASPWPRDLAGSFGGAGFDGGRQPGNGLEGASGWGHMSWRSPSDRWDASASFASSGDEWRVYRHAYLMDIAHTPRAAGQWGGGALSLRRNGGVRLGLNASHTNGSFRIGDGVAFDDVQALGDATRVPNPSFDPSAPFFYLPGHVDANLERWHATRTEVESDATWSPHAKHELKLGAQYRRHTARHYAVAANNLIRDLQDRVVDASYDGYGYDFLGHETSHDVRRPTTAALGLTEVFTVSSGLTLVSAIGVERIDERHLTVGPPLGPLQNPVVSVDARSRSHLTWLANVRLRPASGTTVQAGVRRRVSAPALALMAEVSDSRPERAIETDFSADQALGHGLRLRASAWNTQYAAVPETRTFVGNGFFTLGPTVGRRSRGLEVVLERRRALHLAKLSWVLASSRERFTASAQRNIAFGGAGPPDTDTPAPDDRRHRLIAHVARWTADTDGTPGWRRGWRADLLLRAESGAPYTPTLVFDEVTLAAVAAQPAGPAYSARLPWASAFDLGLSRELGLRLLRWDAALQVYNLFDRHNVAEVYSGTGRADETGWLETPDGQAYLSAVGQPGLGLFQLAQHNPSNWQPPRTMTLSVRARW